jgi:hypothetical protein
MLEGNLLISALNRGQNPKGERDFALGFYQGAGFHVLNRYLWDPTKAHRYVLFDGKCVDLLTEVVEPLDTLFKTKGTALPERAVVWRGTALKDMAGNQAPTTLVGHDVQRASYVVGTVDRDQAVSHAREHAGAPLLLRIEVPAGVPLLWLGWLPAWQSRSVLTTFEDEVVLPRHGRLKVCSYNEAPPSFGVFDATPARMNCVFVPPPPPPPPPPVVALPPRPPAPTAPSARTRPDAPVAAAATAEVTGCRERSSRCTASDLRAQLYPLPRPAERLPDSRGRIATSGRVGSVAPLPAADLAGCVGC